MEALHIKPVDTLIISIVVLYLGSAITGRVEFLQRYSIPRSVTGGLLVSLLILIILQLGGPKITFDLQLRDILLLAFFSTIGLSAKISRLKAGGKTLGLLVLCAGVFLVLQDATGVGLALVMDVHPAYGLFGGSVSFAGGHGTAIAWGQEAEVAGLMDAGVVGVAFATFGLVTGGLLGGPIGEWLIKRHDLAPATRVRAGQGMMDERDRESGPAPPLEPVRPRRALDVIMVLALCVSLGDLVNRFLFAEGVRLPGFLTAMMAGIVITNLADARGKPLREGDYDKVGAVCLQLFLSMSLMSLELDVLGDAMGKILLVLGVQMLVITLFAAFVVFRVMGRTYDAAVISAGFTGLGLGATPVAIANIDSLTERHGPSFKAFLVIPLVGAFFIDLLNALVIKLFLALPVIQQSQLPG